MRRKARVCCGPPDAMCGYPQSVWRCIYSAVSYKAAARLHLHFHMLAG